MSMFSFFFEEIRFWHSFGVSFFFFLFFFWVSLLRLHVGANFVTRIYFFVQRRIIRQAA